MYFTQVHEDAIVEYCLEHTTFKRKSQLYEDLIQPAFSEMVDKIVYTYRFTTLPNIDELRDDCKVWLTTILAKYDPNRGSKAFSYFSVITKNWFIHKVKKNKKKLEREVPLDIAELDPEIHFIDKSETFEDKQMRKERIEELRREMLSWKPDFEKQIVTQLNKMRKRYRDFKKDWENGEI